MNTINATYTIPWCRDGVPVTKIFYINGTGRACYFYSDGLTNIEWTPNDAGWTEGDCWSQATSSENVQPWYLGIIAWDAINNTWSGTLFDGAPDTLSGNTIPWTVQSFSITALGVTDAWFESLSANQILVTYPDLSVQPMFDWQTLSFSVVKDEDGQIIHKMTFTATGTAYASINYTTYP